jgi:hypothetical protein
MSQIIAQIVDENLLKKFQFFELLNERVNSKLNKKARDLNAKSKIIIMLISSKYTDPYIKYKKFLIAAKEYLPTTLTYLYSSKNKFKGLLDTQMFFPSFFTISFTSFILIQHLEKSRVAVANTFTKDAQKKKLLKNQQNVLL